MKQEDLIAGLMKGQLDWKNFSKFNPNLSAMGYDADIMNFMNYMGRGGFGNLSAMGFKGFDADFKNFKNFDDPFELAANMTKKELRGWLDKQVASGAMSTYKLRIFYTPGAGVPAPVDVSLFQMAFNTTGVFNAAGDLVFTNAGGDTATIHGLTTGQNKQLITFETLSELTKTEPFTIAFIRMKPKTTGQLDFGMGILSDSQYGGFGGNSITPDDYVDPDQFQLLRVDVPMNVDCSNKKGFSWTIDEDQTGSGVSMTLFIGKTLDPGKQLQGKAPIRSLNDGISTPFFTPSQATGSMKSIAQNETVKQIMESGVNPEMGARMISSIIPGLMGGGL